MRRYQVIKDRFLENRIFLSRTVILFAFMQPKDKSGSDIIEFSLLTVDINTGRAY
jgi:hypothetical protein